MDDEAVSGTGPEDPVFVVGSGILGHTSFERHTDRWGAVHLTVLDSIPGEPAPARTVPVPGDNLAARITRDLAEARQDAAAAAAANEAIARTPARKVVAFDHAPLGAAGTLVAHVIAVDSHYAYDDGPVELRAPRPGERVVLGTGTLFAEKYSDAPVIGVRPGDGRAENWMDPDALARCRNHLVRLEFEMSEDSAPATGIARRAQAARQEGGLPQSVVQAGQADFPVANPLALPAQAASEPARRPGAAGTAAAAEGPRKPGR
jgi:hypothetical protein